MKSILLIDDDKELLADLRNSLSGQLPLGVEIRAWTPAKDEVDARAAFETHIDEDTTFVATDYDLTREGPNGFFGTTIVGWCQSRAIPVGNFSRGNISGLPATPDLFRINVPPQTEAAARFIAAASEGFSAITESLRANPDLLERKSPASVLSAILGVGSDESVFSLYAVRIGPTSGALTDHLTDAHPSGEQKTRVLSYIIGHILLNAVLRFPGPIVSLRALAAYLASDEVETAEDVQALFAGAVYAGPFSRLDRYFWLTRVDNVLEALIQELPDDTDTETLGEMNRLAIENALKRTLKRHACPRCDGVNGGSFCPLTHKTVCLRRDCSVGSNSWIPAGAKLCRIERDYFEEWAPILGL